jgi:hypothetical protein
MDEKHSEVHGDNCGKNAAIRLIAEPCLSHRFTQILLNGTQDLLEAALKGSATDLERTPENEKPHRRSSQTSKSFCRCGSPRVGLGSGVGPSKVLCTIDPGKDRVQSFHPEERLTATEIVIPEELSTKASDKRTNARWAIVPLVRLPIAAAGRVASSIQRNAQQPYGQVVRLSLRSSPGCGARGGHHRQYNAQQYKNGQHCCYEHNRLDSVAVTGATWDDVDGMTFARGISGGGPSQQTGWRRPHVRHSY